MSWINWPNRITIARTVLIAPLVIGLLNLNDWGDAGRRATLVLWLLMGFSDALDGFLARRLHEVTVIGKFLDPLSDKLMVTVSVILLAFPATAIAGHKLPNWVPVVTIGKDLIIAIGYALVQISTGQQFTIRPRPLGKASTLLEWLMVAAVLAWPDMPSGWNWVAVACWWLASTVAVAATVDYVVVGNRFAATHHKTAARGRT
ncbi:MAG TPA: CDP-alcohol phosphatidyltransferase family protein [Phycisphaerae bacterium]|jgi:cardiolipin synthase